MPLSLYLFINKIQIQTFTLLLYEKLGMNLQSVHGTIDNLLETAESSKNERLGVQYHYIADYYRINAEPPLSQDKRKVVLNTLKAYPDVQLPIHINELSEQYKRVATRDAFRFLTEWAYRYGSKGSPVEDVENPDTGERVDEMDDVVNRLNTSINETELTVNDVSLALKLAGLIWDDFDEENYETVFNTPRYQQISEILNSTSEFIEMKQPEIDWDKLGGTFDSINNQTQQDVMKEAGKRAILRELKQFESDSIEEYLEQNNH